MKMKRLFKTTFLTLNSDEDSQKQEYVQLKELASMLSATTTIIYHHYLKLPPTFAKCWRKPFAD